MAQQSGDEECVCYASAWAALVRSSLGGKSGVIADIDDRGGENRRSNSVYASVGGIDGSVSECSLQKRNYSRPLMLSNVSFSSGRRHREEEAMLRRCRARALDLGLSLLAANISLELARLLAYRRQHAGSGDGDGVGELDGSSGREDESPYGCVTSSAWDSIQDAGRMLAVGSGGPSLSTVGRGGMYQRHRGATTSLTSSQSAPTDS